MNDVDWMCMQCGAEVDNVGLMYMQFGAVTVM